MDKISPAKIAEHLKDKLVDIRQQSKGRKYGFVVAYLLFNLIYCAYWADFYNGVVSTVNGAVSVTNLNDESPLPDFTMAELVQVSLNNKGNEDGESLILSGWYPMAKMFGNLLDINCAFILLPVCRSFISQLYNISTDQRGSAKLCNFVLSFMPLDKALQFHKLCAFLIVVGTVFHTWAHFNHFADVPNTYEEVFGPTVCDI